MKRKVSKGLLSAMVMMLLTLGFSVTALQTKAYWYYDGKIATVQQVGATYNSVTIQWTPATGTTPVAGYMIYLNTTYNNSPIATLPASTLSYTVAGIAENLDTDIYVVPYANDPETGSPDRGYSTGVTATTLSHVINVGYYSYGFEYSSSPYQGLKVQWDYVANCDGYQAVLYKKNGQAVQTLNYTSNWNYYNANFTKATRKQVYYVQVRSYVTLDNGIQAFGDWSTPLYCVPDPIITSKNADVGHYSIKMKWKKISGASSYNIYVSNKSGKKGKKVATVKGNKSSYTIKKVGKSKVNTAKKTYYITVTTNAKFGKSTKKSKGYYYTRAYSYYY